MNRFAISFLRVSLVWTLVATFACAQAPMFAMRPQVASPSDRIIGPVQISDEVTVPTITDPVQQVPRQSVMKSPPQNTTVPEPAAQATPASRSMSSQGASNVGPTPSNALPTNASHASAFTQTIQTQHAPRFATLPAQYCGPSVSRCNRAAVCPRCGVDEAGQCCCQNGSWQTARMIQFDQFGQGEYVGPHRLHHVPRYRLRVDDQINLVYRLTRELSPTDYRFDVGDQLLIEAELSGGNSTTGTDGFERNLVILPDGDVTLPLIGQVQAAGRTVQQLREEIEGRAKKWYKFSVWTVTPIQVNTRLEDLRNAVDARAGQGGQSIDLRVSPDGTIQPPAIGPVCVQGLTLEEAKFEIDQRYAQAGFPGIEVSPVLTQRAPTFVYVLGEVNNPGRFTLERPTTVMGAVSLAGSWRIGGNLRQVVVFRRADDWRLIATKLNLQGALMGNRPTPMDEIFLRDADIVLVPKRPIQRVDDAINLIFTQGINPMLPLFQALNVLEPPFVNP